MDNKYRKKNKVLSYRLKNKFAFKQKEYYLKDLENYLKE